MSGYSSLVIKDFFNPPSLVLKTRAPIMPKAMLAGPSNDAALQHFCYYVYGCCSCYFLCIDSYFQPTLYVPYVYCRYVPQLMRNS